MFAVVEANGFRVPSFQTNVLSCKAWAYFPAANDHPPFIRLYSPHGIVLSNQLIELNHPPPIVLLLPLIIALNCPPPITFLLPSPTMLLLDHHPIVLPSPSAVIVLELPHPIVNNVPSIVFWYPHAIVLSIHCA
jgi:hypothetical protein